MKFKKLTALGLALIAPFSLSGCLILPGEFTSEMTVMKSGEFTFSYKGQIQMLGLASMLNDSLDTIAASSEFEASCWGPEPGSEKTEEANNDEAKKEKSEAKKEKALAQSLENQASLEKIKMSGSRTAASASAVEEGAEPVVEEKTGNDEATVTDEAAEGAVDATEEGAEDAEVEGASAAIGEEDFGERECTAEEIAEQKAAWEETQETQNKIKEEQKKIFAMLLGGIDPKDPKTIERFAKEVERLASWHKVEHLGDGLFMIDYSSKGQLADDFAFPVIPRYAIGQPMVHITRWDNGRVRVEAPSFHTDPDFSLMAMIGSSTAVGLVAGKGPKIKPVEMKGAFTLITDARILANNTEDGPEESGKMSKLIWNIGPEIFGPPMALLKLN